MRGATTGGGATCRTRPYSVFTIPFPGSPAIAADGSVIGALFDGNIHSLGGTFGYDPALNRSVVVSTGAVEAELKAVYPAPHLLAELHAR